MMSKKICIVLTGERLAGKGLFCEFAKELCPKPLTHIKFSDVLNETLLEKFGIANTTERIQGLANFLTQMGGQDIFARIAFTRALTANTPIVILDGMRRVAEHDYLRSKSDAMEMIFVYITANYQVRAKRHTLRNEKADEHEMTTEQLQAAENAPTEIEIPLLGENADYTIFNNQAEQNFKESAAYFFQLSSKSRFFR